MKKDKRKGLWAGYKKAGPTLRFIIILTLIAVVSPLIYCVVQMKSGASKKLQEEARIDRQNKHKELLSKISSIEATEQTELLQTFPQGYILFAIDHEEHIVPYTSKLKSDYKVNWNKAKVIELTSNKVEVQLPDIYRNKDDPVIINCQGATARYIGYKQRGRILTIDAGNLGIVLGILSDDDSGIIIVLGFQ